VEELHRLNKKFFKDNPGVKPATRPSCTRQRQRARPQGIIGVRGLNLLQNRPFVTGMPVAGLPCHELNAWTDSDSFVSTIGYHGAVSDFKRRLIEATLHQSRGNRTHAARALGAADLLAAAHPRPRRRGRRRRRREETGRVEV